MPRLSAFSSRSLTGIGITLRPEWNLAAATYTTKSFSVLAQDTSPSGLSFSKDGTTMYMAGKTNSTVYQYTLSTPWDISTASYANKSVSVSLQIVQLNNVEFKNNGLTMYVAGWSNPTVYQYTLTTAWDISTALYSGISYNFTSAGGIGNSCYGMRVSTDGTKFYINGNNDTIFQFNMKIPWDVSTASYSNNSKFVGTSGNANPTGIDFKYDGTIMFVQDSTLAVGRRVTAWLMTTPWDLSTATESTTNLFAVGTQDTNPYDMVMRYDGLGFYVMGPNQDTVFQYSMGAFGQPLYSYSSILPQLAIGSVYGGGYYAGQFSIAGTTNYKLIVSPVANEQSLQIKTTFSDTGTNTTTIDGFARSNEMNTVEFPAASYCRGLTVGGFTDWYLPARDELEMLYRNFKPTTGTNSVSTFDGQAFGTNTNSIPTGSAYTSNNPGQTSVDLFKSESGAQAFITPGAYWSSSRSVSQPAYCWTQNFFDGSQFWSAWPTVVNRVRPVRREIDATATSFYGANGQSVTVTSPRLSLVTTAQSRFGSRSLQGTTVQGFAGRANAVNIPLSVSLVPPFTAEAWVYLSTGYSSPNFDSSPPLYLHGPTVDVATTNATNSIRLYGLGPNINNISYNSQFVQGGSIIGGNNDQNATPIPLNTWTHMAVAIAANGTSTAIWINGTRRASSSLSSQLTASMTELTLNAFTAGTGQYMDEVRVSNIDRYGVSNATITVPTAEFVSDANTVALVKF
jgi:hypothetical protein